MDETQPDVSKTNVNEILDTIINVLERMNDDNIKELKKNNENLYIDKLTNEFKEFSDKYYTLFRTVIDGEDITNLFKMLEMIQRIQNKEIDIKTAEKKLGDELANQYLYPALNKNK